MIHLHSNRTPNSYKAAIMLEETGLEYGIVHYDILKGEHLTPAFRDGLNPNCKLPVISDENPADGGEPFVVFETGAILVYLAEKTGRFMPTTLRARFETIQWTVWQVAGLGPMHGQAHHFARYAPDGQDYGLERYTNEARRLLAVMEHRLRDRAYLAVDYSIADIACWPFVNIVEGIGVDLARSFPRVHRWWQSISDRAAVQHVLGTPELSTPPALLQKRMILSADEWSNVFGTRMLAASSDA